MNSSTAYFLVFHGSQNSASFTTSSKLADLLEEKLADSSWFSSEIVKERLIDSWVKTLFQGYKSPLQKPLVGTAALELADLPLNQSVVNFAQKAIAVGYQKVQIIPLFLSAGVHVREDIPREIDQARRILKTTIQLQLLPPLGSYRTMITLLAQEFAVFPPSAKILLSHGSRLPGGNLPYENLAMKLGVSNAYWSCSPDLKSIVVSLVQKQHRAIAILPYFLFPGRITEAIASEVTQLQKEFPQIDLILGQPLAANPELADLIIQQLQV